MVLRWINLGVKADIAKPSERIFQPEIIEKSQQLKKILIIEDQADITDFITPYCEKEGYYVERANSGEQGLEMFESLQPSMILLDLVLPRLGGLEVCRRIRNASEIPIIVISARHEEVDKILALETGADDYLTKPFSPRELMARIRLIIRRYERGVTEKSLEHVSVDHFSESKILKIGKLSINLQNREVLYLRQQITTLTKMEFELLVQLARYPGRIYSSNELAEAIYGLDHAIESRVISVHISNLRNKLPNPELIVTCYGLGYKLIRESD
ncbi:MAG: response regulator transcription factor [Chloroflexi bacterium]|uniref:Response regulator transcription factor n=1 Tax=Candidatus Chlorohelix allophototropha TaxID=3003348 RepID=A0A8T7M646_9CHLR|nr:response regulator transcription factor [Chloroflexota bacterium]WJW69450.1 response regulator transcription factor [Chloroflexota bacterium L227-S17]